MAKPGGAKNGKPHSGGAKSEDAAPAAPAVTAPAVIEPTAVGADSGAHGGSDGNDNAAPRGRGRPAGSRSKKTATPINVGSFADLIVTAHVALKLLTSAPEWDIEKPEAENMAQASMRVMALYDIKGPSEEIAAWINLVQVVGFAYGSRLMVYRLRKAEEKRAAPTRTPAEEKRTPLPDNVTPMVHTPLGPQSVQ